MRNLLATSLMLLVIAFGYPVRDLTLAEYKLMSREFYKAFKVKANVDAWMKCLGDFLEEANENLKIAISKIQDIREQKLLDLINGLQHYRNYVMQTIYDSRPCVDINKDPEMLRVRKIVENIDWQRLIKNLSKKFDLIMHDFVNVREIWNKQNIAGYGKAVATLLLDCLAL